MTVVSELHGVTFIGTSLPPSDAYCLPERACWATIAKQIKQNFPQQSNLLISTTWFGPQFDHQPGWQGLMHLIQSKKLFDNVFFLATVDPCYLTVTDLQWVKNAVGALRTYHLGNFDNNFQFNFFAIQLAENFQSYDPDDIRLKSVDKIFINYNRKPKPHRVDFVKKLIANNLLDIGIVTLGQSPDNTLYLTLGEKQQNYVGTTCDNFGIPMDYYTLHRLDLWKTSFLYVNAATEFDPTNDLFCQQDTFKPLLGLRPFVINGVQRTYRWLRSNGFRTFNHYWSHIDIENSSVHDTIVDLIKWLSSQSPESLVAMYNDMLADLQYNQSRFYEFANEQKYHLNHLFDTRN